MAKQELDIRKKWILALLCDANYIQEQRSRANLKKKLQLLSKSPKNILMMSRLDAMEVFSAKTNLNSTPGSGTLKLKRVGDDLHPPFASLFPDHRSGQWWQISLKWKL